MTSQPETDVSVVETSRDRDRALWRMSRFYPLETLPDKAFATTAVGIAAEALGILLKQWAPVLGLPDASAIADAGDKDFLAQILVCQALGLLDEARLGDLKLLVSIERLAQTRGPFSLSGRRSRALIEQLSVMATLDEIAADGGGTMTTRVIGLNLQTPRDRLRMAVRLIDASLLDHAHAASSTAFARFSAKAPEALAASAILTDDDATYREALTAFESATQTAIDLSRALSGRPSATSQIFWASVLFTRLCNFSVSLSKLLPGSGYSNGKADEVWDNSSVASLVRDIFECFLLFHYLCIDPGPPAEASARQTLMHLHDCTMRLRVFYVDEGSADRTFYEGEKSRLKAQLEANTYFQSLSEKRRQRLLAGRDLMFLSQDEILDRLGEDRALFRRHYEMLSAHTHSLPLSFYRALEDGRGRGVENSAEKNYISQSLATVARFLGKACQNYAAMFAEAADQDEPETQGPTQGR
ncbi:DUF5677 domain-containing protein [Brevundimonas aurifodinae]|uniref:DUF5677 domain-containing protein n=1 Tax=Brevundimonas aurifodinae TaxID=1508312 RepID=A0ABV1NJR9_9CAUL